MVEILWFELAHGRYGVPLRAVREVVRAVAIAPLPGAPPMVEGAIDLRGQVVAVLDIRARFGLAPKPLELSDIFIITESTTNTVALRVDRAGWPITIPESEIAPAASPWTTSPYVAGVARTSDGLVVIHDVNAFLTAGESAELAGALAGSRRPTRESK